MQFAEGWVKHAPHDPASQSAQTGGVELDLESLLRDIGNEVVPVVERDYDTTKPLKDMTTVDSFVRKCWLPNNTKWYLHQWQFPLSETAAPKLCHKSTPLSILGDDLTSHWLDRCSGDSPFQ